MGDRFRVDVLLLAAIAVAGFVAVVVGAVGAAHADRVVYATPYVVSGGLVGVGLVAFAALVLVLVVRRRADAIEAARLTALTDAVNRHAARRAR